MTALLNAALLPTGTTLTALLNIALLLTGTTATLSAFGGESWKKSKRPFLERVTPRGWISLFCLALALGLGVVKEFYTKGLEDNREAEGKTREQTLQSKLDAEDLRLKALQTAADATALQLNQALGALATEKRVVTGISTVEGQIHGQVDTGNKQIRIANENLQKSAQVLDQIGSLQTEVRNVSVVSALALPQERMEVRALIPINSEFDASRDSITETIFPKWGQDGRQGPEDELISIDLISESSFDKWLHAYVVTYRGRPNRSKTYGSASDGLEKISATGSMGITFEAGRPELNVPFTFNKSLVLGHWLKVFTEETRLIKVTFMLRSDISASELQAQVDSCNRIFSKSALVRIPMTDQGGYFVEYNLSRGEAAATSEDGLTEVSVVYSITSPPSFHSEFLEKAAH